MFSSWYVGHITEMITLTAEEACFCGLQLMIAYPGHQNIIYIFINRKMYTTVSAFRNWNMIVPMFSSSGVTILSFKLIIELKLFRFWLSI